MTLTRTFEHRGHIIEEYDNGMKYHVPDIMDHTVSSIADCDLYIDITIFLRIDENTKSLNNQFNNLTSSIDFNENTLNY